MIFYGSYDWYLCVYGYWFVLCVFECYLVLLEVECIVVIVDVYFIDVNVVGECVYFVLLYNSGFEWLYGWVWLFVLFV